MDEHANGVFEFQFPCGRKFGDLRGDEMTIIGAEMQRLGKIVADADDIMKKYEGATPITAKERHIVAVANAITLMGNPLKLAEFEQRLSRL